MAHNTEYIACNRRTPLRDGTRAQRATDSQLRTSFDTNKSHLLEYLAQELEEKLQWEEDDGFQRLKAEELQHDDLETDLIDQNAELQAEADSAALCKLEPHMLAVSVRCVRVIRQNLARRSS